MPPFSFAIATAPRRAALIVAETEESIQDSYDTGKKWPPAHGTLGHVVRKSSGASLSVRAAAKLKDVDAEVLKAEVAVMKSLDHVNILRLLEVFEDSKFVYLVVEHCPGGLVLHRLLGATRFEEEQAAVLMKQLFRAVRHMHERRLCHRNLHMDILYLATSCDVGPESVLKVGGLGWACEFTEELPLKQPCGCVGYKAPEVIDREYSSPCDLWSCGVILFYMLCGYLPFTGGSEQEIMRESHRGAFFFHPVNWGQVSESAKELIRALLRRKVSQRCSAAQALHHQWFKGAKRRAEDAAFPKLSGAGSKPIEEHADEASTSEVGLDLELDADPSVEDDIRSPLHVNSSARPVLLMGSAA